MTINRSITITASVGRRGINRANDLRIIRERLNELMPPSRNKINLNAPIGFATYDAIAEFQKIVCGFSKPDSRVDPNKATIRHLNDPRSRSVWAGDPLALACANFDVHALNLRSWVQSHHQPPTTGNRLNSQDLRQLRTELAALESTLRQRYPDGRPSGAGVMSVYAPGRYTIATLQAWGRLILDVQQNSGSPAAISLVLTSPVVVPLLMGLVPLDLLDLFILNPQQMEGPNGYDAIVREIRSIREKLQAIGD